MLQAPLRRLSDLDANGIRSWTARRSVGWLSLGRLPRRSLDEGGISALVSSPLIGAGRLQRLGSSVGRAVD